MADNICAVCMRRISEHSIQEVQECTRLFGIVELERQANKECISCGVSSDLHDPVTGDYYCHGCFAWITQLNDERNNPHE